MTEKMNSWKPWTPMVSSFHRKTTHQLKWTLVPISLINVKRDIFIEMRPKPRMILWNSLVKGMERMISR